MMNRILLLICCTLINNANATQLCKQFYVNNTPPVTTKINSKDFCYSNYATLYNLDSRIAVYSAEILTKEMITLAGPVVRVNKFFVPSDLSKNQFFPLTVYENTSYDKGHLVPAGDMPTDVSSAESFASVNVVPQNNKNNRIFWRKVEDYTRMLSLKNNKLYVITGPLVENPFSYLKGRLPIPNKLFKAIYIPSTNESSVLVTLNDNSFSYEVLTLSDFSKKYKIRLFPSVKNEKLLSWNLPKN